MSTGQPIRVGLEQESDYAFRISFDDTELDPLLTDEPAPLGHDQGPNPSRLLLAAIANCMAASLLFALRKFKNTPGKLHASISAGTERNADGRWRIPSVQVELQLADPADDYQQFSRILEQFENFCVVTQSVRAGIEVGVTVKDGTGAVVYDSGSAEPA
ncbi:peroxiredoxin [Pseudoxanthomonas kalamensis DSM 18571]|uniref:OsmC family protein n=1 Tax=Pseudoxanthomonas kalamensis TaxID=289483 RepID=UPI001391AA5E|nr:OsmC family protein [Pseudoxanthomonas kalamensis]KAF1711373.1 peroxiredoxin [Pseudoxanthomonas kalamensis DSM 18571]